MTYTVDANHVFTFFFIMLGPIKMIAPFAKATAHLDGKARNALAWKAFVFGTLIAIAGGFAGMALLANWGVSVGVMLLGAGIVFFLFALSVVVPREAPHAPPPAADPPPAPTVMQVIFPMMITPYGMAALIAFLATSQDMARTLTVLGLLLANMVLDLLCMLFVRPILKVITPVGMQIVFSVLGVLMVGLALQIVVGCARLLAIIPPLT